MMILLALLLGLGCFALMFALTEAVARTEAPPKSDRTSS